MAISKEQRAELVRKGAVETTVQDDRAAVREIGVDYAQGYAIGKPSPFENVYPLRFCV